MCSYIFVLHTVLPVMNYSSLIVHLKIIIFVGKKFKTFM